MYDLARTAIYLGVSAMITVGAAWKLHLTGRRFLVESHSQERQTATSTNRMLTGSFCLLMAGYLAVTADFYKSNVNLDDIVRSDLGHLGGCLMFLGFASFLYLFVMGRLRGRARRRPEHGESILA